MSSAIVRTPVKWYSAFDPRSISGCQLWIDAADTTAYTLSGSNVATVRDKSGTAKSITVSATPPTFSTTGFNTSFPCFIFSTSNFLSTTLTTAIGTGDCVFAAVMQNTGTAAQNNVLTVGVPFAQNEMGMGWNNSEGRYKFYQYGTGEGNDNFYGVNTNLVLIGTRTSSTMSINLLGRNPVNTGTNTVNNTNTAVYIGYNVGPFTFAGRVCEVLLYVGTTISTAQRRALEGYLATKWGLSTGLIAAHPYRSSTTTPITPILRPFTRGFQPSDIPSCVFWLDGTDISTMTFSGSNITSIRDKSTNLYSITPLAGNTATLSSDSLNGNRYINLGANVLTVANFVWRTKFTVFLVIKCNIGSFFYVQRSGGLDRQYVFTGNFYLMNINNTLFLRDSVSPNGTAILSNATWAIFCIGYNNGTIGTPYTLNGTTRATAVQSGTAVGDTNVTFTLYLNGKETGSTDTSQIAEIVHYADNLAISDVRRIEGYLAHKWGLANNLITSHPFYRNFPSAELFTPLNIPNCALWLDASDYNTVIRTGSTVTAWNDKSGNGINATPYQSPTVTTVNGLQAITLGGTRNFDGSITNGTANVTVFAVAVSSGGSASYYRLVSLATFNTTIDAFTNGFVVAIEHPNDMTALGAERNTGIIYTTGTNTIATNTPFIVSSAWTATTVSMFINGTSRLSSSFTSRGNFTYANYAIGRAIQNGWPGTNPTFVWPGIVCEVIIYNAVLTTEQRQQIEGQLAWKWNLRGSLPLTHPYYKFRP